MNRQQIFLFLTLSIQIRIVPLSLLIHSMACIFCDIVSGQLPSHKVWEDENYLAFLSIFPNTLGTTVVIPKQHYPSYAFDLPEHILIDLLLTAKKVAKKIDHAFTDVGRTGLVFEGFGVDHIHAKLFPMHGTKLDAWKAINSTLRTFYNVYPGYIASHDGERMDDERLAETARLIRESHP